MSAPYILLAFLFIFAIICVDNLNPFIISSFHWLIRTLSWKQTSNKYRQQIKQYFEVQTIFFFKLYLFYNNYKTSYTPYIKSCLLAPMFAFGWPSNFSFLSPSFWVMSNNCPLLAWNFSVPVLVSLKKKETKLTVHLYISQLQWSIHNW